MRRKSVIQHDQTDCGAACLASVASHYQLNVPIAKVRLLAGTDELGTNMLGLVGAAEKLGFEAKGVKATMDSLVHIPLPSIAHVIVNGKSQHFVVVYKASKNVITLMDPADGKMHKKKRLEFGQQWTGALLLLLPGHHFKVDKQQSSNFGRLWSLLGPNKFVWLQAFFGAIIYTVLGLSTSIFVQKITDHVIADSNKSLLNIMGIFMISLLLLQTTIGFVKNLFVMRTGQQIDVKLILGYYKHLLRLPQHFFDRMRVGEIISRLNDAVKIRVFVNDALMNAVVNILIVVFSSLLMFSYNWKLAFLVLSSIPIYAAVYWLTNQLNKKMQRLSMEQSAELEAQLVESLHSIKSIKTFGIENFVNEKTDLLFVRLFKTVYNSGKNGLVSAMSAEVCSRIITIALLWIGALHVLSGTITTGELFSFYTLVAYFTGPIATLIGANKTMQEAFIAADRLFQTMDLETELNQPTLAISSGRLKGDIRFENVKFSYGTRRTIFQDINLHIKAGSFTAIVGESGSGKSTLATLLHQLYPITSGTIRLGHYQIQQLAKDALRKHIGVVPQHIDLFAGNVIDNIALGDYQPNVEEIVDICRHLGFLKFIEQLPNGFHTQLGENGAMLSGGEKQRIAIARALYRKPEVLILDEATSSLDAVAENHVKKAIDLLLSQQKTIIVIAHRLSTIRFADHIIVLSEGNKVEEGNHLQLMKQKGHYSRLWANQFA